MKKVIEIDKELCIGCGLCTTACHNGVIEIVDGKAEIIKKDYCDGLGLCLPDCPTNAINLVDIPEEADTVTASFTKSDAITVHDSKADASASDVKLDAAEVAPMACGCSGTESKTIKNDDIASELMQWPVQLRLINSFADYLQGADLLVAADCTAYAYSKFHKTFIKNHITVIACPKLDDNDYNTNKLTEIFENNDINTVTVVKMSVPCCGGISRAVHQAVINSGKVIPVREETISTSGELM